MRKFRVIGNIKNIVLFFMAVGVLVGAVFGARADATVPGDNTLVNYDLTGSNPSSGGSQAARISEDGNIIVWSSVGHDVIANDPYSSHTSTVLYKRNIKTGLTSYVSVDYNGVPVHVVDSNFAMSRNGRYVVFQSRGTNIVVNPVVSSGNNNVHLYLRDTLLGTTTLVDKSSTGVLANGDSTSLYALNVSDDGRFVLFSSISTNLLSSGNPSVWSNNRYVKDMRSGEVINPTVSNTGARANGSLTRMFSSCDGSIMVFSSNSTNLTAQDTGRWDVYLVDMRNGYEITNLTHDANQDVGVLSFSCNGRYILVGSTATNLTSDAVSGGVPYHFRYDRLTNEYSLIEKSNSGYISTQSGDTNGSGNALCVSDDGKVVFLSSDRNMVAPAAAQNYQVYLRNPDAGTTELVPINSIGVEQNVAINNNATLEINAKGNAVLYNTRATNLVNGMTTTAIKLVRSKVE